MDDSIYRLQQQAAERVNRMRAYERSFVAPDVMPEPLKPPPPPPGRRAPEPPPPPPPPRERRRALPHVSREPHPPHPPREPHEPHPPHEPFGKALGFLANMEQDQLLLVVLALCLLQNGEDSLFPALALLYVAM